ncbi:MAG: hypothetical protein KA586_09990 [Candidatus Promineofilum sp.]|nr:hypothetical protein [Promineifilum sp.]
MSNIHGNKQYEQRARLILPILVRQAQAGQTITYMGLSRETGIHQRGFSYPLGTVAEALQDLSKQWGEPIPALTSMVIYATTGVPGPGFGWAVTDMDGYKDMRAWEQKTVANKAREECFHYDMWPAVLHALRLKPLEPAVPPALVDTARGKGGEGEAHRRLKEYVAAHPEVVGHADWKVRGRTEYHLPSSDAIDVLFQTPWTWLAVEVKAANAGTADILRGLFQCVKYQALLEAEARVTDRPVAIASVLVLEGALPNELVAAHNTLGITVFEGVSPGS